MRLSGRAGRFADDQRDAGTHRGDRRVGAGGRSDHHPFVATTHAGKLGKLEPVFVDVRASDPNIDTDLIEAAITPRRSAIVAVHCYGNPCDVDAIKAIADRHGLTVIYDAAHAFGVRYRGEGLLRHGDYSTLSFHATKAFNTFEGGAVVCGDAAKKAGVDQARNLGIASEVDFPSSVRTPR